MWGMLHMEHFYQTVDEIRCQSNLDIYKYCGRKLVIFGAGDCGHIVYEIFRDAGIGISCFCDNKMAGKTDEETGLPVMRPEDLAGGQENILFLICVVDAKLCEMIYGQLLRLGYAGGQIDIMRDYYDMIPLSYFERNMKKYMECYQLLEDGFSRKVYRERIKKVCIMGCIADVVSDYRDMYFDEKIVLSENEVFVDCGGYDGNTSVEFIKRCGGRYKKIVIFEPELCKKEAIKEKMSGEDYELHMKGVWSESTKLYFDALGTDGSHVSDAEGGYVIETVRLDDAVYDLKPTYIKMDIEGSEQEALKGCGRILKDYKPKLAVCLYHKPSDLFEIPRIVKKLNPNYRLFVRQYSDSRFETVLYAI